MHNPKVFDGLAGRATYALDPNRPLETGVHCSHFQRAIAEFLAFEADNFSTRRTVADIFGCWLPQG